MNTRKATTAQILFAHTMSQNTYNVASTSFSFNRQRPKWGILKLMIMLWLCAPRQSALADKGELEDRPSTASSQVITRAETSSPDPLFQVRLLEGHGVEVCEAYMQNLNSVKQQDVMVCERDFNSQYTDFAKVPWRKLDPDETLRIAMMMYDWFREDVRHIDHEVARKVDPDHRVRWENGERYQIAGGNRTMYMAEIDITNDGVAETVVKDYSFKCPSTSSTIGPDSEFIVLDAGGQEIDVDKTRLVNPGIDRVVSGDDKLGKAGISRQAIPGSPMYDVFTYKGETYFDLAPYGITHDSEVLWVFQHRDGKTRRLCKYKYGSK